MSALDRRKYLTPDEVAKLLDLLDREAIVGRARGHRLPVRDAFAFRLALCSGARASELAGLNVGDVTIAGGGPPRIRIRRGKGGKARDVILPSSMRPILKDHLTWLEAAGLGTGPEFPLLPGRDGKPMGRGGLFKRWSAALERAGLPHRPLHASRHTCGLVLYRQTRDLLLVKKVLGHSKTATTEIYSDLLDADVAEAMDRAFPTGRREAGR